MAKHTLKILLCEYRKIFKVCLAILQQHVRKGYTRSFLALRRLAMVQKGYCIVFGALLSYVKIA